MRRLAALVLMLLTTSAGVAHASEHRPIDRQEQCRYESWNGQPGFTHHEAKLTIGCAVDHFPTSLEIALAVAARESGFECRAANPTSSAGGVFQIVEATWASWWDALHERFEEWDLRNNRYTCRANILIAIAAAHRWSWQPWGGA